MTKTMDILTDLRKDFAEITGILLYLQDLGPSPLRYARRPDLRRETQGQAKQNDGDRQFSASQKEAIDSALQGFSFIVVQNIGDIRKSFGERLWYKLEDIDKPKMDKQKNESDYGIRPVNIIEQIKIKARDLNKKLLTLPGDDKCSDEQSVYIEKLFNGLEAWRNEDLAMLIREFG